MKKLLFITIAIGILSLNVNAQYNFGWAVGMGGNGTSPDTGYSITTDATGNVYVTGLFYNMVDFDPGAGTTDFTSAGSSDIFVQKLDASGNLLWAKSMGGTFSDGGASIATDATGNVYVMGFFKETVDFDPGAGTMNLTSDGGSYDTFVLKLDATGNFLWAKAIGGTATVFGRSITMDATGNVYVTGIFVGAVDFDPGTGIMELTSVGGIDIFVLKLDGSGNLLWAKAMGGPVGDNGKSITTDALGNVYVTGDFQGTVDFDPGAGTMDLTPAGGSDIFVLKLDASGNLLWADVLGGLNPDTGNSITLDASGNVYVTGYFMGTADFDPGAGTMELTSAEGVDVFVFMLDASGNFLWAGAMGGDGPDSGQAITTDASGNVYVTGGFVGTADFDPGAGTMSLTSEGGGNIFVEKFVYCTPLMADVPSLLDLTGECEVVAPSPLPTATNSCGTFNGTPNVGFPITDQSITEVIWTYEDGGGNTSTQTQNVIFTEFTDATAPVADLASLKT